VVVVVRGELADLAIRPGDLPDVEALDVAVPLAVDPADYPDVG
jgi:hypothetical protein